MWVVSTSPTLLNPRGCGTGALRPVQNHSAMRRD